MSINEILNGALLSEASYANLRDEKTGQTITDPDKVEEALIDSGFSKTQAKDFVTHWRVVDHQQNTSSGFSATVFESNKFDNHTKHQHKWRFLA